MAGEVEDPVGFQGECPPTGSISFGRFESEVLSWERRSSFSHNRYLEEVEKLSSPGSVTQKKAYFEAHFKKRGLLRQASSMSQSSGEGRPPECESEDQVNCREADEDCFNEDPESHESINHEYIDGVSESCCIKDVNFSELQCSESEQVCLPCFDDNSMVTEEDFAHESGDGEGEMVSFMGLLGEQAPLDVKETSESSLEMLLEMVGTSEHDISLATTDNPIFTEPETISVLDEAHHVKCDVQKLDSQVETKTMSPAKATLPKSTGKTVKPEQKSYPSNGKRLQGPSNEKNSVKGSEKKGSRMIKPEKQPSSIMSSATPTISRIMKSEVSKNSKVDRISLSKSQNDLKIRNVGITPQSNFGRKATAVAPSPNRPIRVISSANPVSKASSTIIESKSSNTAGMRIKEVVAKMKEFRKSLDFKATPMPSFYREAVPRAPIERKTPTQSPARPQKPAQTNAGRKDGMYDASGRRTIPHTPRSHSSSKPSTSNPVIPAAKDGTFPHKRTVIRDASSRAGKNEDMSNVNMKNQSDSNTRKDQNTSKLSSSRRKTAASISNASPAVRVTS